MTRGRVQKAKEPPGISLVDYARHRQVTKQAVSKAIAVGRLDLSLVRHGRRWRIRSAAEADAEWDSNTRVKLGGDDLDAPADTEPTPPTVTTPGPPLPVVEEVMQGEPAAPASAQPTRARADEPAVPPAVAAPSRMSLVDAQRMLMEERARKERAVREKAELDLALRRGQVVEVAAIKAEVQADYARVRTHLRAVPAQIKLARPELDADTVLAIGKHIDRALEELGTGAA